MFEKLGYFKEYYLNNKYIGSIKCEKDRDIIGYYGKKKELILQNIFLENKKKIKNGTFVETILYPLCGKTINQNK